VADIFLSYSNTDRPWVARFAETLAARGLSVFWDRRIPVGKQYDQVIQRELDAAGCIIVLWSKSSISSNWVKEEAEEGVRRGVLCPVLIEEVRVPLGLRRFQTARLIDWQPGAPHPEFDQLMQDVALTVARKSSSSMNSVDGQLLIGKRVQNYQVVSLLGSGGMGSVYQAVHPVLGRQVAIKILRREYAQDPQVVDRFINEAKAANAIRHAGIVDVIDVGTLSDGLPYLVMELLAGETVRERLSRGLLPVADAVEIARQTAGALAAGHDAGIVHRDVKPENLFLVAGEGASPRVKVLDFGIAKLTSTGLGAEPNWTKTGAIMGTPPYMSPEQCRGAGDIDRRTDIYALGIILFEMLTGRQPFRAEGFGDLMMLHMNAPPPAPRGLNPTIPFEIEAAVLKALAKRPEDRFQRMQDLARALGGEPAAEGADAPAQAGGATAGIGAQVLGRTEVMADAALGAAAAGGTEVLAPPPPAWTTPTTMTDAASEIRRSPEVAAFSRSRTRRLSMAAAGLLGIAGIVWLGYRLWPAPTPTAALTKGDAVKPPPPKPPDPPPPPRRYSIAVSVQPTKAFIDLDGARVGTGVFAREMAADGTTHKLRFHHKGYADKVIEFDETTRLPESVALKPTMPKPKPPPPDPSIGPFDTGPL
jgi:eukaryotic-like serine/threonine-protein kinase